MRFSFVSVINWFGGKSFFMALVLVVLGTYLQLRGKLNGEFLTLLGIVQALVMVRSIAQDMTGKKEPLP